MVLMVVTFEIVSLMNRHVLLYFCSSCHFSIKLLPTINFSLSKYDQPLQLMTYIIFPIHNIKSTSAISNGKLYTIDSSIENPVITASLESQEGILVNIVPLILDTILM